ENETLRLRCRSAAQQRKSPAKESRPHETKMWVVRHISGNSRWLRSPHHGDGMRMTADSPRPTASLGFGIVPDAKEPTRARDGEASFTCGAASTARKPKILVV